MGQASLAGPVAIGDKVVVLNYKGIYIEEVFYYEGGKILLQVAQRGLKYPISKNI